MALPLTVLLVTTSVHAVIQNITCPILSCTSVDRLTPGVCFEHDGVVPTKKLMGAQCQPQAGKQMYCPFEVAGNQYSWIEEYLQGQDQKNVKTMANKETSQIEQRKMQAYCKDSAAMSQDLNAGRDCQSDEQCKSRFCSQGLCKGLPQGVNCHSDADCDSGLFCETQAVWPYQSKCTKYYQPDQLCTNDFQCANSHICWFKTSEDRAANTKRCLEIFSQDNNVKFGWHSESTERPSQDDFRRNGRYCKSGLAAPTAPNEATCTRTKAIEFQRQVLNQPYKCSPQNPNDKCTVRFDLPQANEFSQEGARSYLESDCSCALTDQLTGFCENVIGTEPYFRYTQQMRQLLTQSRCHTLDRSDLRAQRDSCGLGLSPEWQLAVDLQFNVTHWPYIQSSANYQCVTKFFADSYTNLAMGASYQLIATTVALLSVFSSLILL